MKNAKRSISRRNVLSAGLSAPLLVPHHVLGGAAEPPPSDKLRVAVVGVGGMGKNYIRGCSTQIEPIALCDLDHGFCRRVFEQFPKATLYHDYRKMFEKEAKWLGWFDE